MRSFKPLALLLCAPLIHAQAAHADFDKLFKELSNWGRWGQNDQIGAVNLITPAKRKQAAQEVQEGVSISLAHDAETKPAADNPQPIVRGALPHAAVEPGTEIVVDSFYIAYHGLAHTHMDSLCHFFYQGQIYNGYPRSSFTDQNGASKNGILNWKNGIFTRGILIDIPRLKGVEYLEPGTPIYPQDLDAWEKKAHIKVGPGDVVLIRTGRWARRAAKGPWASSQGLAGLYMTCARWLHQRDVAILGSDAAEDVMPSRVQGISQPIHELVLIAMGMPIFDNCDLEQLAKEAAKRNRWDFLITAAPAAVPHATGSVLNPIATF